MNHFLKPGRKMSELGLALIKKDESAPAFNITKVTVTKKNSKYFNKA